MDLAARLLEHGGVARRSEIVGPSGWRALRSAVAEGQVLDHGGGCYGLPGAPLWLVRARQFGGHLTCVSWAEARNLPVLEHAARVHLAVPRDHAARRSPHRPVRAVVLHRQAGVVRSCGPELPVADAPAALATTLRCQPPLAALVVLDAALAQGLCTAEDVRAELRGRGSVRAALTLGLADLRSQSPLETVARVVLRAAGLEVRANVDIAGVGRVDLLVEGTVVVELDGFEHHSSVAAFGADRRRDRRLHALGLRVLRFTSHDVLCDVAGVVAAVRAALRAPPRATEGWARGNALDASGYP